MKHDTNGSATRRGVMKGIGISGLAAISMSNTTAAQAQEVLDEGLASDPHAIDTYRSIVDAIIPRTPQLEDELGPEHVPGGLDIELEQFLIYDFNHFQEVRLETITDEQIARERFETVLDMTEAPSELGAVAQLADSSLDTLDQGDNSDEEDDAALLGDVGDTLDDTGDDENAVSGVADVIEDTLDIDADLEAIEELLDFGPVERFEVTFADDLSSADSGPAEFDRVIETEDDTDSQLHANYPYANAFAFVFDIVAADFIARGENEDDLEDGEEFPAGGTFVRLSREDRLRALWSIIDDGTVDRLDEILSEFVTTDVGILKFVVMATNGLHGFGYYTEWSGYGDTKTDPPRQRELQTPTGEVQSHQQTGYPGPQPGYAADWRHAVPDGFDDPDVEDLDLPDDLEGDDVIEGIGGSDDFNSGGDLSDTGDTGFASGGGE